ncbi:hypothetical protein SNE40_021532 [Patella caerulea]|uniref:HMG box domain-containing protein n=1 Tax=Patella caerulea TaxID=87958 RepID=A0AAN8GGR7_PATCE
MSANHVESSQEIQAGQLSPNKKRKHKYIESGTDTNLSQDDEITFKSAKTNHNETCWTEADKEIHVWLKSDIRHLMDNLEAAIIEADGETRSCIGLEQKINWDSVKFGRYSAEDCQSMWKKIQKKVKKTRTMCEVMNEAKQLVSDNIESFLKFQKSLTAEELYVDKKLDEYLENNSDVERDDAVEVLKSKYNNLSDRRKEKYKTKAKEMLKVVRSQKGKDSCPKAPLPVNFFIESKLESTMKRHPELSEHQARLHCRSKFRDLKDSKKIKYINKSIDAFPEFQKELRAYFESHPDVTVKPLTSYLSKPEITTKLKYDGFPAKPPLTGYSLFSVEKLHSEAFMKDHDSRTRFRGISDNWKGLSAEEKKLYDVQANEMKEEYRKNMKEKLLSISEQEKDLLSQTIHLPTLDSLDDDLSKKSKKKTKTMLITAFMKPKKTENETNKNKDDILPKIFPGEPQNPKRNAYALFVEAEMPKIKNVKNVDKFKMIGQRWRDLSDNEKQKYRLKASELDEEYKEKLEEFKQSLDQKSLDRYQMVLESRKKKKKQSNSKPNPVVTEVCEKKELNESEVEEEEEEEVDSD